MENSYLFFIGIVLGLACFGFLIYKVVKYCRAPLIGGGEVTIDKKLFLYLVSLVAAQGLFTIMSSYGFALWGAWNMDAFQHLGLIFGSYFFGTAFSALFATFVIYYYKPTLIEKQRLVVRIVMFTSIAFVFLGLYAFVQSIGNFLNYPLPNGINFEHGFSYANVTQSGFTIAFYGIIIVTGAVIVYFICDHYFFKKFNKHGLIDTTFLVAFPMGIIGARLWYCLILEPETYLANPLEILFIWDGGLAIQGGALFGIVFGVGFMLLFRKYINIRWAMDIIVPTILIAQAIGRWGNFFNCEVHGNEVLMSSWSFLPSFITNQMQYSTTAGWVSDRSMMYLPLFLIESVINFGGYFIIRYAIGKPLKKYLALGDQAMMYVIWYGAVRALLEPLRYGFILDNSEAGYGYLQSWITAFVMIGIGILGIVAFHVYDLIRKKKGMPPRTPMTV